MAHIKSIDYTALLDNCLKNKEWAQKELYDLYSSTLYAICCRYAKEADEAKDMLQESFIKIFTNLKQYKASGSLEGWMKRVVVTTALNYIKKNKKFIVTHIDAHQDTIVSTVTATAKIAEKEIIEAFIQLPYTYRVVLGLYIIDGYTYKEISEQLGIEEATCRTKVYRGKLRLQQLLQPYSINQQAISK